MAKKLNDGLDDKSRQKIIDLCKAIAPAASIWLYGSRARGDFTDRSDVDIALESKKEPIDFFTIAELKDVIAASDIGYKVDVVDFNSISDRDFKENLSGSRVLWKS